MTNVYDQHDAAFNKVNAYIIVDSTTGDRIATVAFKHPKDGMGGTYCYLHFLGLPMQRDKATGCGYDKQRAAFEGALAKCLQHVAANKDEERIMYHVKNMGHSFTLDKNGGQELRTIIERANYNQYKFYKAV